MTRLLVCGDWHGDAAAAQAAAKEAVAQNCDVIVQVGDFGYWPHIYPDYVHQVNKAILKTDRLRSERHSPLYLVWIDGNHECFTGQKGALFETNWPRTEKGFWRIADRVLYAPRGHRWKWNDTTFLALGGGYSIDKEFRLFKGPIGLYWWPEETITQRDVYKAIEGGPVDVMFTHDMPQGAEIGITLYHNTSEDEQNRMAVRAVVDAVKPKLLFHGHYHHRQTSLLHIEGAPPVQIESLDMWQGLPIKNMWTVLDLTGENDGGR